MVTIVGSGFRKRRKPDMTKGSNSPFVLWTVVVLAILCGVVTVGEADASMDISAFEYFRKFGKHLELGECPQREVVVSLPNNTSLVKEEACNARQKGTVTSDPRVLSDIRHVAIQSANDLVAYLGLCGGEAASYLGLLNNGDCIVVDIASKLSFNKKILIRAYYLYFHKSLDILDVPPPSQTSNRIREGLLEEYMQHKYFVKNRSYGTMELILLQFRFRTRKQAEVARNLTVASPTTLMSDYMKKLEREVGKPRRTMILTLSTATEMKFKADRYDAKRWGTAVRDVELRESIVSITRQRIDSGRIRPNLNYQLFPFTPDQQQTSRSSPLMWKNWEKSSMMEVSLRVSLSTAKKSARKCRKNKTTPCRRVRELRRKLVALQAEVHRGRSNWMTLTPDKQQGFYNRYSRRVTAFGRMTGNLARQVHKMKKAERLRKLKDEKNKPNQSSVSGRIGKVEQQLPRDWSYIQRIRRRHQLAQRG